MRMRLSSRAMLGCMVGMFLTTSVGLFLTACYAIAQQPEQKQAALPDGLRHVPPDALGFVHVRVGAFLKSELGKQLLNELQQDGTAKQGLQRMEQEIEQQLGVGLADLDNVTVLMLSAPSIAQIQAAEFRMHNGPNRKPAYKNYPSKDVMKKDFFDKKAADKIEERKLEKTGGSALEPLVSFQPGRFEPHNHDIDMQADWAQLRMHYLAMSEPLVIVTSTKPLDRKKVVKSNVFPNHPRGGVGGIIQEGSLLFLSDRSILIGTAWEVDRYSEQMARNPGPKAKPMQAALALGRNPHVVVAGGHVPAEIRQALFLLPGFAFNDLFRALVPVAPLLQSEAGIALDLGKSLDLTMQFKGTTDANAEQALQAAKNLLVLAELAIEKSNEAGEPGGWKLVLQKQLKQALADAVIEQKGLTVHVHLKMEFDLALVKRFTKEFAANVRTKNDRTQSDNNLRNIALAMHGYHDAYKRLPPAGISSINDPNGKPLLSWRVAILPFIEEAPLYKEFDLTLPWDHPRNKKLIGRMPTIYVVPGTENKEGLTHYRVLVGPQTMFEPGQPIRLSSITDGTSNTIMAVEAKEPTIWTRPDDLPFDPKGALPKFGVSPDGFLVLFGDGVVRFIRSTTPAEQVRAMITRNGGEVVEVPD